MRACATMPWPAGTIRDRIFGWTGNITASGQSVPLRLAGALHALHLRGHDVLAAQLGAARKHGVVLIEDVVQAVVPRGTGVEIELRSGATVRAGHVVVAAGSYSALLVRPLAQIDVTPIAVAVLKAEVTDSTARTLEGMPAMIHRTRGDDTVDVYAVPPTRYPDGTYYLKLGVEVLPETELGGEAAMRRWMQGDAPGWRDHMEARLAAMLPEVPVLRTEVKPCLYAKTPGGHPIIDHVAQSVVVAAGGNGRAAKSADAIGELAARLALDGVWSDPLPEAAFAMVR